MTGALSSVSPIVFETTMFIKYNVRLWSLPDVVQDNKRRKIQSRGERREKAQQKMADITDVEVLARHMNSTCPSGDSHSQKL